MTEISVTSVIAIPDISIRINIGSYTFRPILTIATSSISVSMTRIEDGLPHAGITLILSICII